MAVAFPIGSSPLLHGENEMPLFLFLDGAWVVQLFADP
jgi:hypothetical protein